MRNVFSRLVAAALIACCLTPAMAQTTRKPRTAKPPLAPEPTMSPWDKLVDQFFDDYYFPFHPTEGTSAGFHRYDAKLEDFSRKAVDDEIAAVKHMKARFEAFDASRLTPGQQADRDLVIARCDSRLLSLVEIRNWEKNPNRYSSNITNSAFVIMSRRFAPPEQRLKSLIARERQMPKALDEARANLKDPPEVFTKVAIQQLPGIIGFFQKDVPEAFSSVKDQKLLAEFKQANSEVIDALRNYRSWLEKDLLPRSKGDFRIGAENYRKKLLYDEMVDTPLDQLLKIGYDNLHQNQKAFEETAKKLDPDKTPQQLLDELGKDYPPPDRLLQTTSDLLTGLRDFLEKGRIVTVPSQVLPIVEETPPFARALTFASMDTPGPYEHVAKEAFFNVTLPEKDWDQKRVAGFMAQFNYNTLVSIAVHEAYPGHYTQFLWVPAAPSKVRKLLGCGSNAEGWAHYSEQMMLDEGYGDSPQAEKAVKEDKRALRLRLGQLQDALLRNARYIVGIEMHTGKMTFDQAIDFFVKEGYQPRAVGEVETKRGTSDPTYLVYTLGKLQILKLRDDYKKLRGDKFSLREFHDQFLKQGFPPVKIIRRAMLGNDSPVL
ncbi:MAG: DUF885 domain-containing protein [Acidobacteriia bacterium]|nr:DUF885 domain-containing protein [Terriglobia bacterium]